MATATNGLQNAVAYAFTYADAAARVAATGLVAADIGKLALQQDTNAIYLLTATTPTWVGVGGAAVLTVEEVDGSPTDSAVTKIVFPNTTLAIAGHVATYTPVAAADTLIKIAETVLATTAASVNFASIPGTYRALRLVGQARGNGTTAGLVARANGDTAANYDTVKMYAGASVGVGQTAGGTAMDLFTVPGTDAIANAAAAFVIDVPNYAGTSFFKGFFCQAIDKRDNAASQYVSLITGSWRSTAAITAVSLAPASGSWIAGSTFTLYGMK